MQSQAVHIQQPSSIPSRETALRQLGVFQHLSDSQLHVLAENAVLRVFLSGTTVIAKGTRARHLFLLLEGVAEQSTDAPDHNIVTLTTLEQGDLFGEGGLFGQQYRRTTVHAVTHLIVLQWSYNQLFAFTEQLRSFFETLRILFRERLLSITLAQVPSLAILPLVERLSIAEQISDQWFDRGSEIIREGEHTENVFIIAEGQVQVTYNNRTVAVLESGDIFGEMSFLDDVPHEATVTAWTPVHVLMMPASTFVELMTQHPGVAKRIHHMVKARRTIDRTNHHITITEQLVSTGYARGNMVLARQPERCAPDCHLCETACGERFQKPRLSFSGNTIDNLELADTCRHCKWGAECVEACPENAFQIDEAGRFFVTDRCTGCGECIEACPYDAINQVPVYPTPTDLRSWIQQFIYKPQPLMQRANKCDGCSGYEDYACVSACPTGALQWIPVEQLYQHKVSST
jgi:CRP-like cAMP-binding protein/Fe-S-cluster-containing hydrogenase component 2